MRATLNPSLLLSRGLARPRTSLRIEYETSCEFNASRPSTPSLSEPSDRDCGTYCAWNCSRALMSLTDASTRSFFEAEDNFQNNGSVVDILANGHKFSVFLGQTCLLWSIDEGLILSTLEDVYVVQRQCERV